MTIESVIFDLRIAVVDLLTSVAHVIEPDHRWVHIVNADGSWTFKRVPVPR